MSKIDINRLIIRGVRNYDLQDLVITIVEITIATVLFGLFWYIRYTLDDTGNNTDDEGRFKKLFLFIIARLDGSKKLSASIWLLVALIIMIYALKLIVSGFMIFFLMLLTIYLVILSISGSAMVRNRIDEGMNVMGEESASFIRSVINKLPILQRVIKSLREKLPHILKEIKEDLTHLNNSDELIKEGFKKAVASIKDVIKKMIMKDPTGYQRRTVDPSMLEIIEKYIDNFLQVEGEKKDLPTIKQNLKSLYNLVSTLDILLYFSWVELAFILTVLATVVHISILLQKMLITYNKSIFGKPSPYMLLLITYIIISALMTILMILHMAITKRSNSDLQPFLDTIFTSLTFTFISVMIITFISQRIYTSDDTIKFQLQAPNFVLTSLAVVSCFFTFILTQIGIFNSRSTSINLVIVFVVAVGFMIINEIPFSLIMSEFKRAWDRSLDILVLMGIKAGIVGIFAKLIIILIGLCLFFFTR